jgi:hypothetical protein
MRSGGRASSAFSNLDFAPSSRTPSCPAFRGGTSFDNFDYLTSTTKRASNAFSDFNYLAPTAWRPTTS